MNRIAVISDIHGNALALEAVLNHARQKGITEIINLGDIFYGPLWPLETYRLLEEAGPGATIRGNQDRLITEATEKDLKENPTLAFVVEDLGSEVIQWLRLLSAKISLAQEVLLCHGTPKSDTTYLLEDVSTGRAILRSKLEIMDLVGYTLEPIIFCGHSHIPRVVRLSSRQMVVNPGSVGLPAYDDDLPVKHVMETGSPHASYAILELGSTGWDVSLHRVGYDWEAAAQRAEELGRKDWARGLATGWMR